MPTIHLMTKYPRYLASPARLREWIVKPNTDAWPEVTVVSIFVFLVKKGTKRRYGSASTRLPHELARLPAFQDHASGSLLIEEAGGLVSNCRGESLSFGLGRTLGENYGVVASGKEVHPQVLSAIQTVRPEFSTL